MITHKELDAEIEKRILTGFIVSTDFCGKMLRFAESGYFRNRYAQRIFRWVKLYYDKYEQAPSKQISTIFEVKAKNIPPAEAELILTLLDTLSAEYEQSNTYNEKFLVDEANMFFKQRKLEMLANNVQVLIDENKIDEAQKCVVDYTLIMPGDDAVINPADAKTIQDVFLKEEIEFLKFPGKLGEFMGNMLPGWLVCISGKTKGYKSFFMQEFAYVAVHRKIPTIFYSLEMTVQESLRRWYRRIIPSVKHGNMSLYPVFDCEHNQNGTCDKEFRINKERLTINGEIPEFSTDLQYRACDYCRKNLSEKRNYRAATWYTQLSLPKFDYHDIHSDLKAFNDFYGQYFRYKIYPRYSKSVEDIENHLDILRAVEGFVPRVIIIDYADILRNDGSDGFMKEDEVWMKLAALGGKRNALIVTGTQADKAAQTAKRMGIQNTAKWIGKNFHLDKHFAINQTSEEKTKKVCRISKILDRYDDFSEDESVMLLMNMDAGQFCLDSEVVHDY